MSKTEWIAENLKAGEEYAGIILGKDGQPDHHLILLSGEAEDVTFKQAQAWAKKHGGDLPTRREQSLLFANLKDRFQPRWYWSGEPFASASDYAWGQHFGHGGQSYWGTSYQTRARAVRRLEIQ